MIYNEPLFLPKGSIRGIIALLTIIATIFGFLSNNLAIKEFMPLTGTIIGYYFGSRIKET